MSDKPSQIASLLDEVNVAHAEETKFINEKIDSQVAKKQTIEQMLKEAPPEAHQGFLENIDQIDQLIDKHRNKLQKMDQALSGAEDQIGDLHERLSSLKGFFLIDWGRDSTIEDLWLAIDEKKIALALLIIDCGTIPDLDFSKYNLYGGDNALRRAAEKGLPTVVEALVQHGCNVNAIDSDECASFAALHHAAVNGMPETVKSLISVKANINALNGCNQSALHCAVLSGNLECVKIIIDAGVDIHALDDNNKQNALHLAPNNCSGDQKECICRALLDAGINPSIKDMSGQDAFFIAAATKKTECVKTFIAAGTNIHSVNDSKMTALHIAAQINSAKNCQVLIAAGIDVNAVTSGNETALHKAAGSGCQDDVIANILLNTGIDVNVVNTEGLNSLHIATRQNNAKFVQALIAAGIDVNAVRQQTKQTALHMAVESYDYMTEVFDFLMTTDIDINAVDSQLQTALHFATYRGYNKCARALLEKGCDKNPQDIEKATPFDIAIESIYNNDKEETCELLHSFECKTNIQTYSK